MGQGACTGTGRSHWGFRQVLPHCTYLLDHACRVAVRCEAGTQQRFSPAASKQGSAEGAGTILVIKYILFIGSKAPVIISLSIYTHTPAPPVA